MAMICDPTNHATNCCFCLTNVSGFIFKTQKTVIYPNTESISKPLPHDPVTWIFCHFIRLPSSTGNAIYEICFLLA